MNLRFLGASRRPGGVARFPFGEPGDPLLAMLPPRLETIPVSAVVGSVDRHGELGRGFRPRGGVTARLAGIQRAMQAGATFPPIEVYRLGGACYVLDGHHRVAAALHIGQLYLDALVIECRPRRGEMEDPLEEARVDFGLRSGLRALTFGTPERYAQALSQIHEHRWYLGERGRPVSLHEAADDWYETVYLPVIRQILAHAAARRQSGETGDLYMQLCDLKYGESRERGHDIGFAQAIRLWASRRRQRRVPDALLSRLFEMSAI